MIVEVLMMDFWFTTLGNALKGWHWFMDLYIFWKVEYLFLLEVWGICQLHHSSWKNWVISTLFSIKGE